MDAGIFDALRKATNFICMIEQYQSMTIFAYGKKKTREEVTPSETKIILHPSH